MNLEVISRMPKGAAKPAPLLFVHGAFAGAWVWDVHFLPWFAERGYAAHALSLRGHGASAGIERLTRTRLRDYVTDVERVMAELPAPPVLIGHSLGGMVVQKILHRQPVPGAVLMGSAPPHGMIGSFGGIAFGNPELFRELVIAQAMGPAASGTRALRRALFSDDAVEATVNHTLPRLGPESPLVALDLFGLDLPPSTPMLDLPVLVIGAENDAFVFEGAVKATADTYRAEMEMFPGMAHAMMLEREWEAVAERMLTWLDGALADPAEQTGT